MRAYRLAYDGRPFHGFQRQPDVPTVEGAIVDALRDLGVASELGIDESPLATPRGYSAAGRTDAGVSARSQVVAFDAPSWLTPRAFNGTLPPTVRAWASADVPAEFHATHDAATREYVYFLSAPDSAVPGASGVDADHVRDAVDRLAGRHDFHNLTPDESGTVRTLETAVYRENEFLRIHVVADGFPRHLVRRLVTLVRAVGAGDTDLGTVDRILSEKPLSGAAGFGPAPAEPLVLWDVTYAAPDSAGDSEIAFDVDDEALESARIAFGERHVRAAQHARVTEALRDDVGE